MLKTVEVKCNSETGETPTDLERSRNMLASPDNKKKPEPIPTVKLDKIDVKPKANEDDPKPRIVLTFRSEKTGTRSNNMKIVTSEEKQEEISPRRSSRIRIPTVWDSEDEGESSLSSPKKEKVANNVSENDDASDGSTPKRSTRGKSKEFSDNVIANAIARKEKYNEAPTPQRPSRRIKPTPKVLGNKELRWLQSQPQSNVLDRSEDGVMTRRSARRKSIEAVGVEKKVEKAFEEDVNEEDAEGEEMELEEGQAESGAPSNNVQKLKHLCELGLRAINPEGTDSQDGEERDEEMDEDEELDEELISKLCEGETDGGSENDDDDEEFLCAADASFGERPRRSTRLCSGHEDEGDDSTKNPTDADDGPEATCPEDETAVVAACCCDTNSNVFASPKELVEPVFCQAVEVVDGIRVGCSHPALRGDGGLAPLVRAGPRAPFILACEQHARQLHAHMCCAACGCFCTQGVFYRCNKQHYFHVECGISSDPKQTPGCPHCGVYSYRWQPVNRECRRVRVTSHCANKRVFLPDQRVQSTPAYLGFSSLNSDVLDQEPIVPKELLPTINVDLATAKAVTSQAPKDAASLYRAVLSGTEADDLLCMIVSCDNICERVEPHGATVAHAAARRGNLAALYLAQYAGADLDAEDGGSLTPLMWAVRAITKKYRAKGRQDSDVDMEVDGEEADEVPEDKLLKVIRYLVAAGCDVNIPGPEGMTALHTAAQHGHEAACAAILHSTRAAVDPRDHGGWTPLVWAAELRHSTVVRLLLQHGADPTATDNEGNAPAHWCALAGDATSLRLLVDAAPRAAHALNRHRDTPLHVAARQGHYACVVILLAHGANTELENSAGERPVDVRTGECQTAIMLNMQMAAVAKARGRRHRILCSDISNGREQHPVPCVNEVDDAPAPDDFMYVTQHVTPKHVPLDTTIDTLQGCSCADGDCTSESCPCQVLGVRRWWQGGRLAADFPYHEPPMLFQCNHTCRCNTKLCVNATITRLTAHGSLMVRCCVFRAGGARGWGLRAAARVPRGSPVATYCGELLALADADARSTDHYMFALDVKPDLREQCEFRDSLCVDAARYGSAARFINHSCRPNLAPVRVFVGCRDLRVPTVCLFATRDIAPNEELSFDYGDKFWSVKAKWMKCECGTSQCRYAKEAEE